MLKNILEKTKHSDGVVSITYDQKPIVISPGESLDVRDFGVSNEQITNVERHILLKNPNVFEQSDTKDIFKTNKAALKRIKELESEVESLVKDLEDATKSSGGTRKDVDKLKAENEGLANANKSQKETIADLKAKIKQLS